MNDRTGQLLDAAKSGSASQHAPVDLSNTQADHNIEVRVDMIREEMIDRIWSGLLIIVMLGVPASLSRTFNTGWLPMYTAHLCIGALVILIYFLRHRLPFHAKVGIAMAMFWAVGLIGIVTLGMLGAGVWWLVVSGLVISILYTTRLGVAVVLVGLLVVIFTGYAFVNGHLVLPFDANAYIVSPSSWLTLLIATSILPFIVFQAVATLNSTAMELLIETEEQRIKIHYMATHDHLTGLPTMNLAGDRLKQALLHIPRTKAKVALLFIDLDGFKAINDNFGHQAGDVLLRAVAGRMQQCMRAHDTIARIGGDEFIAVLEDLTDANDAMRVSEQIIEAVLQPVKYEDVELRVGASVGVAIAPEQATQARELLRKADEAMYEAKGAGKGCAVLASGEEQTRA